MTLTDKEMASLHKVVDYMKEYEGKHYEETPSEEKHWHIYNEIVILEEALANYNRDSQALH
jgi:hypothetical protein